MSRRFQFNGIEDNTLMHESPTTLKPPYDQLQPVHANIAEIAGTLVLACSCSLYALYGIYAFPRQEWLLELMTSLVCLIPSFEILAGKRTFQGAAKFLGLMILTRSLWDALHWPTFPWIQTPIDPILPRYAPFLEIPIGTWLVLRARVPFETAPRLTEKK